MTTADRLLNPRATAIALVLLCVAAYWPGLFGGFLFDDFQNIVENAALQSAGNGFDSWLSAALSSHSGALMRPISMLSFAVNDHIFGLSPIAFKAVNLLLHIANATLIYLLCRNILPTLSRPKEEVTAGSTSALSMLVAGIWLLHPLNVSTVLYVVQRMTQLSTFFVLLGLLGYTVGRLRSMQGQPGLLTAMLGSLTCAVLATLSKENGALIFAYAFTIELICFRFATRTRPEQVALIVYFSLFLLIPLLVFAGFLTLNLDWLLAKYEIRDFTLMERLLTECRILLHYGLWVFVPLPQWMGIYHDDIAISTALVTPWTTLPAILLLVVTGITAVKLRHRAPFITFAVLWFAVGHSMESTILPLELVFEHRNYLPMVGLLIGAVFAVRSVLWKLDSSTIGVAVSIFAILPLTAATTLRSATWGDPIRLALQAAADHPNSARSQYDAGRMLYMRERASGSQQSAAAALARPYFVVAMQASDTYIHPVVSLILTSPKGQPISEDLIKELRSRIAAVKLLQPTPIFMLFNAITDRSVDIGPENVNALFETTMENSSLNNSARAMMLSTYGRYAFVALGDHQLAVSLTLAATEQDPLNPIFRLNLAKIATALNTPDVAIENIRIAEHLDVSRVYGSEIQSLRQALEEQK